MARKILVTGATGFIGSHVVRQLVEKGEQVAIVTRGRSARTNLAGLDVEERTADLTDAAAVRKAVAGCTHVYHIAGHIATARRQADRVYASNLTATRNIFDACRDAGVERVLYLASIFALGGGEKHPFAEDDPYNLGDLGIDYFNAKRKAELLSYEYLESGLPLVHVYPNYCFGPGDVYVSSSRPLLGMVNGEIPAYITGGLNAMDVRDAAAGLILGMEKGKVGRKYLIGGDNLSWRDFFEKVSRVTGLPVPRMTIPRRVGAVAGALAERVVAEPILDRASAEIAGRYWFYDDSRARNELGYTARPLEEAFRDAIRWFVANGYVKEKRKRRLPPELR